MKCPFLTYVNTYLCIVFSKKKIWYNVFNQLMHKILYNFKLENNTPKNSAGSLLVNLKLKNGKGIKKVHSWDRKRTAFWFSQPFELCSEIWNSIQQWKVIWERCVYEICLVQCDRSDIKCWYNPWNKIFAQ